MLSRPVVPLMVCLHRLKTAKVLSDSTLCHLRCNRHDEVRRFRWFVLFAECFEAKRYILQ